MGTIRMIGGRLGACTEALSACVRECERCEEASIGQPEMAACVRACRDCAELSWTCFQALAARSPLAFEACRDCVRACDACAAECEKHGAEQCRRCAEACRRAAAACRDAAA